MAPKLLITLAAFLVAASGQPPAGLQSSKLSHSDGSKLKLSHLRFFFHDIVSGSNPTAVTVARSPARNGSTTLFGMVNVMDDPLTAGPALSSGLIGRAQGLYASASQETEGLLMAMSLVFVEGKYNGSTVSVLGRNQIFTRVREMPIVGGTRIFRFARGYVQASTYSFDANNGNAVVEYNCYVLHY